ncbi:MAG: hypothetical protein HY553_21065 [Elusimicrobia bacterium]|nr:hypothetical protein [Elusimicrobiota bacterium]
MLRQGLALALAALLTIEQGVFCWAQNVRVEVAPVGVAASVGAAGAVAPVKPADLASLRPGPTLNAIALPLSAFVPKSAPRTAAKASFFQGGLRAMALAAPLVGPGAWAVAPAAEPADPAEPARGPQAEAPAVNKAPAGDYTSEAIRRASEVAQGLARTLRAETAVSHDAPIEYPVEYPQDTPKTLAELPLEPVPGKAYTPSPEDWSDQAVYFPLIDRFAKGEGARPVGDPRNGRARHGGNLAGLIDKLDYIKNAGFTTLLINPIFVNAPDGYHGYSPLDFLGVDPHLGTMADFKRLVDEAHKRGMYVIFDLAINHAGAAFEYKGDAEWEGMDKPRKEIDRWNYELRPHELKDPRHFSRRGVLNDWEDPDQKINADFPPYQRRFDTANPETQDALIKIAKWWIRETDVDGFRLDAYKHIAPAFWPKFHTEVAQYAANLGKANFLRPGEILTHDASEIANAMGPDGINAAYNYPAYLRDLNALQGKGAMRHLEESLRMTLSILGKAVKKMFRFLDTQDTYRFLSDKAPEGALWAALGYVVFSAGIPLVYYGTEQALRQAHVGHYDPRNREDLFPDGQYKSESSAGDKFDEASPVFLHLQKLLSARRDIPALRRGEQYVRWVDQYGPGIYAFSRIYDGEEVVVLLNSASETRSATMFVDATLSPPGTQLTDVLQTEPYRVTTFPFAGAGSQVAVSVPAYGVRVLRRPAAK